jgi:aquaporin Z
MELAGLGSYSTLRFVVPDVKGRGLGIHLLGSPVTNTSVNPARSIGPAIFVGGWAISQLWLFIIAPIIGAAIAAAVYALTHQPVTLITAKKAEQALGSEQVERQH